MNINPFARFLFWFIFLALVSCVVFAQGDAIVLGKTHEAGISICLEKQDAIAIVSAEKSEGNKMFTANEKCTNLQLVFTPHKVVYSKGAKVIEIKVGEYTAYWLTSMPVLGYYET